MKTFHANRHIQRFLALSGFSDGPSKSTIQVLSDGSTLTAKALRNGTIDVSRPIVVQDSPESIGMKVCGPMSVQEIADVIGCQYPIRVLDVEHQEELEGWTLGDLVDYYEDRREHRKNATGSMVASCGPKRSKRKAAQRASDILSSTQNCPRVLNQISLEFSDTALRNKVTSPQFVRDLDWVDNFWPRELRKNKQACPSVQYYCLTSAAGCYTDFHIDMSGTSVWYHILSGSKMFCLISPTRENLVIYEQWLRHRNQGSIFLPDLISGGPKEGVVTVSMLASQTLFIPTGWIHAVYTPVDSVAFGGNFLHGLDVPLQLEICTIEERSNVQQKFRFPYYKAMNCYALGFFLHNYDELCTRELESIPALIRTIEGWIVDISATASYGGVDIHQNSKSIQGAALYAARLNGCSTVHEFLNMFVFARPGLPIVSTKSAEYCSLSPESPTVRQQARNASMTPEPKHAVSTDDKNCLRIVISSVARELHRPLPRSIAKRGTPRKDKEDIEFVDADHHDDDWEPSAKLRQQHGGQRSKSKRRKRKQVHEFSNSVARSASPHTKMPGKTSPVIKRPKTTARQRLLKKFR